MLEEVLDEAKKQWEEKREKLKQEPKSLKLKDYERERLLSGKFGEEDEDEEDANKNTKKNKNLSYVQEQEELKKEFVKSIKVIPPYYYYYYYYYYYFE